MTQTVTVPGVGDIDFPDGMSSSDMSAAIQKNFPHLAPPKAAAPDPGVDSSPFKYNNPQMPTGPGFEVAPGAPNPGSSLPKNLASAASAGVDIDTGSPGGSVKAGFADNPADALKVYQKSLGPNVQTRVGPQSQEPEYLNAKTNRWTMMSGRMNVGNKLSGLPADAVEQVPQIAGGLGGAMAGAGLGGPGGAAMGSIAGSAAGGAVGKLAKNAIGQAVGAIPSDQPLNKGTGTAALTAGAWDAASLAGLGLLKYGKYVTTGAQPFTADEARSLLNEQARQSKIVKEISAGSGQEFAPTAAQIATSPASGIRNTQAAAQSAVSQQYAEGAESTRTAFTALQNKNTNALQNYFESKLAQFRQQGLNQQRATGAVAEGLTDPYNTAVTLAKQEVAKLPPGASETQTAEMARGALQAARQDFTDNIEKPAWDAYKKASGYDPVAATSDVEVPWSKDVQNLMDSWSASEKNAVMGVTRDSANGLKLDTSKPTVNLATLDDTIQALRSQSRSAMGGQQGVVLDSRKLNQVQGALTDMRSEFLQSDRPDLKDLLDTAEGASARKAAQFKNGLVDTMLVHDNTGQLRLTDGEALNRLMSSSDPGQINEVLNLIKSDPAAKDQLNQYLLAKYRAEVVNDKGIPVPAKHNQFMQNYGTFVKNSFDPSQAASLDTIGGLATAVKTEYANLKTFLPKAVTGPEGLASSFGANKLVTNLFTSSTSTETLDAALKTLKNYPYKDFATDQWRASAADALFNRVIKDGVLDPNEISKIVQGNNGEQLRVLTRLFNTDGRAGGQQISMMLKNLQEGGTLVKIASMSGANPSQMNIIQKGARAYFGPFSEEGRLLTFLKQLRGMQNPEKIYRALTDPNELTSYVTQSARTIASVKKLTVAANVTDPTNNFQ